MRDCEVDVDDKCVAYQVSCNVIYDRHGYSNHTKSMGVNCLLEVKLSTLILHSRPFLFFPIGCMMQYACNVCNTCKK